MLMIESAGLSDIGRVRDRNEDELFIDDDSGLYIISDGMGGHRAGEIASRMSVEIIHNSYEQFKNGEPPEEFVKEGMNLSSSIQAEWLKHCILKANSGVHEISSKRPSYRGMGATVSILLFTEQNFIAANVGDSPIYRIHRDKIELFSVIHTVKSQYKMSGGSDFTDGMQDMLTRCIGLNEDVVPEFFEMPFYNGDSFVVCSDGLSEKVSPDEIKSIVSGQSAYSACQKLVDLANKRGGEDNISVIVVNIKQRKKYFSGLIDKISKLRKMSLNH